jgi:membrane protein insertase Oxa1/YidC/SpoIIIJ
MELGSTMSQGILGGLPRAIPYVLMLVLMVASQYVQTYHAQRGQVTGSGLTDQQRQQQQTQQMITRIMPLFLGFISWNFPAGLALYWTTGNLFRLGQQFAIFAIDGRPTSPPAVEPPTPARTETGEKPKRPQTGSAKKKRRKRK